MRISTGDEEALESPFLLHRQQPGLQQAEVLALETKRIQKYIPDLAVCLKEREVSGILRVQRLDQPDWDLFAVAFFFVRNDRNGSKNRQLEFCACMILAMQSGIHEVSKECETQTEDKTGQTT